MYCVAFTHFLCKDDITGDEEIFEEKRHPSDIESALEVEEGATNGVISAMA